MKEKLAAGQAHKQTYLTTLDMRAKQLSSDVFSTPAMISLMETTCVEMVAPFLDTHEQTVGIHVDVRHLTPTKIGQSVTVSAELIEVKGNKLRFAVTAFNDAGVKIGDGTHRRALINTKSFAGES